MANHDTRLGGMNRLQTKLQKSLAPIKIKVCNLNGDQKPS